MDRPYLPNQKTELKKDKNYFGPSFTLIIGDYNIELNIFL
jgi:hypothetical protein